jgi:hypothetical protein
MMKCDYNSFMHCSNRKCKGNACKDHTFVMKSNKTETHYKQTVSMALCPKV